MRLDVLALLAILLAVGHLAAGGPAVAPDRPRTSILPNLERRLEQARKRGDRERALEAALQIGSALEPAFLQNLYDIAELRMRTGDLLDAYDALERAADAGLADVQPLLQDEVWNPLRKQPRFRAIVKRVWLRGYIAMLDRKERESFQKPKQVMEALALKPGEKVADLGAGSGYFTIPSAKAVGPTGIVWALDIEQAMLDTIQKRVDLSNLANVRPKLVKPDDPGLQPASVDTVLIVDTWHYIKDRAAYAKRLRPALAHGGRVVVIDYTPKSFEQRPWGPPPEQQLPREAVDSDMAAAGLRPIKVHTFLPEQYFVEYGA